MSRAAWAWVGFYAALGVVCIAGWVAWWPTMFAVYVAGTFIRIFIEEPHRLKKRRARAVRAIEEDA